MFLRRRLRQRRGFGAEELQQSNLLVAHPKRCSRPRIRLVQMRGGTRKGFLSLPWTTLTSLPLPSPTEDPMPLATGSLPDFVSGIVFGNSYMRTPADRELS